MLSQILKAPQVGNYTRVHTVFTPRQSTTRVVCYNLFMQNDESFLKLRGSVVTLVVSKQSSTLLPFSTGIIVRPGLFVLLVDERQS